MGKEGGEREESFGLLLRNLVPQNSSAWLPSPFFCTHSPLSSHCPQSRDVHCGTYPVATSKLTSPKTLLPHYTPITGIPAFSSSSPTG